MLCRGLRRPCPAGRPRSSCTPASGPRNPQAPATPRAARGSGAFPGRVAGAEHHCVDAPVLGAGGAGPGRRCADAAEAPARGRHRGGLTFTSGFGGISRLEKWRIPRDFLACQLQVAEQRVRMLARSPFPARCRALPSLKVEQATTPLPALRVGGGTDGSDGRGVPPVGVENDHGRLARRSRAGQPRRGVRPSTLREVSVAQPCGPSGIMLPRTAMAPAASSTGATTGPTKVALPEPPVPVSPSAWARVGIASDRTRAGSMTLMIFFMSGATTEPRQGCASRRRPGQAAVTAEQKLSGQCAGLPISRAGSRGTPSPTTRR